MNIGNDTLWDGLRWLIELILSTIVSVVLSLIAADTVFYLVARVFGSIIRGRATELEGIWEVRYKEPQQGTDETRGFFLKIFSVGPYLVARNLKGVSRSEYRVRAKVVGENLYITGTWSDFSRGEHHGSFQNVIPETGVNGELTGKWLGFSTTKPDTINEGGWTWIRRGI